jgi:hypothetical protein
VCWALTVARIGSSLFWFLVAPELDARFGQWSMLPVIVAIAFWDNFLRR